MTDMEIYDEHVPEDLFAKRMNESAKGEWFWTDRRLYKGEKLEPAARRVAPEELRVDVVIKERLDIYVHF